jgi:hypothetical protein
MLTHTIAAVRNRKIRNEPIYRTLLAHYNLAFMNIQASDRTSIEPISQKRMPTSSATNFAKRTQAFATPNANLHCIFIRINPFPICATQRPYPKSMDHPMLIAGQPVTSAEPRPVHPSCDGSAIKGARLEAAPFAGQVGNLPHAHTSTTLEAFRISRQQPTQLLPLRCGLSCKQVLNAFCTIA